MPMALREDRAGIRLLQPPLASPPDRRIALMSIQPQFATTTSRLARARVWRQVGSRAPCASTARRRPAERRGALNAFQEAWKAEAGPLDEDAVAAMAKRYGL